MTVDTRQVRGRRRVRYADFTELLSDAARLHASGYRQLGNWSLGKTLDHVGRAMHGSIDGPPFRVAWWIKVVGRVYLWRKLVYGPFPAGFQLPRSAAKKLIAEQDISYDAGLAMLQSGMQRLQNEPQRIEHPVTGPLTRQQWDSFHLSHAAMHMSFFVPESGPAVVNETARG